MLHYFAAARLTRTYVDDFDHALTIINSENGSTPLEIPDGCQSVFDVKNYLPAWLVKEDANNDTLLVKFLQHYFDWYYCPNLSSLYSFRLFDYIDPKKYDENTYLTAINSHLPGISEIFSKYDYIPNIENIKDIVSNIKYKVYQRKGTPSAINILFTSLFDDITNVNVQYSSPCEISLTYYVNNIPTDLNKSMLDEIYQEFFHPCGMTFSSVGPQSFNSSNAYEDDEIELREYNEDSSGVTLTAYEVPILGHYWVYNVDDMETIGYTSGCSGSSHPRAIADNTSNLSTYTHPNWFLGISSGISFGDINISDFVFLPYENNPNTLIPSC